MQDLLADISTLTSIGYYNLRELANKSISVISHNIAESIRTHENITSVDIGIGELHITNIEGKILYKFIPSKKFQRIVQDTYNSGRSKLALDIDESLGQRITNTYKDLF